MDGLAMSLIYALPIMTNFPIADLPIGERVEAHGSAGEYLSETKTWKSGKTGVVEEFSRIFYPDYTVLDEFRILYYVDATGKVDKLEMYDHGTDLSSTTQFSWDAGHLVKTVNADESGAGPDEEITWKNDEFIRIVTRWKPEGDSSVAEFVWRDGKIAEIIFPDPVDPGRILFDYPSADSIHSVYTDAGAATEEGYSLKGGRLLMQRRESYTVTMLYGAEASVRSLPRNPAATVLPGLWDALGRRYRLPSGYRFNIAPGDMRSGARPSASRALAR